MTTHKFKVDQILDFAARRIGYPAAAVSCKVLRLLPTEDGQQPQYLIKCTSENFERVAKESALSNNS